MKYSLIDILDYITFKTKLQARSFYASIMILSSQVSFISSVTKFRRILKFEILCKFG